MYETSLPNHYPSKLCSYSILETLKQNTSESLFNKKDLLNNPRSNLALFSLPKNQLTEYYEELNIRIKITLETLQLKIEPVDISTISSIQKKSIKLNPIPSSLLSKRRTSVSIN